MSSVSCHVSASTAATTGRGAVTQSRGVGKFINHNNNNNNNYGLSYNRPVNRVVVVRGGLGSTSDGGRERGGERISRLTAALTPGDMLLRRAGRCLLARAATGASRQSSDGPIYIYGAARTSTATASSSEFTHPSVANDAAGTRISGLRRRWSGVDGIPSLHRRGGTVMAGAQSPRGYTNAGNGGWGGGNSGG